MCAQFNYYFIINILHIRNASAAAAQVRLRSNSPLHSTWARRHTQSGAASSSAAAAWAAKKLNEARACCVLWHKRAEKI